MIDPFQQHVRGRLHRIVKAVTIGGLDEDIIGLLEGRGASQDDILVSADIPAEGQSGLFPVLHYPEMYRGAADDVAGVSPLDLDIFVDGIPGIVLDAD